MIKGTNRKAYAPPPAIGNLLLQESVRHYALFRNDKNLVHLPPQADLFIVQPVPKIELINASETPHTSFPNV